MKSMTIKFLLTILIFTSCKSEIKKANKDYSDTHIQALKFCEKNSFNLDYYILIDMNIHSGNNRFFVYNFETKSYEYEKLVTHGSCDIFEVNDTKWEKAKFSNQVDSHCSAVGKYKIGVREYSSWGIHIKYWLHGLEPSNSNSVSRVTVLHSWGKVANEEVFPNYAPLSWGCPAISDAFMTVLDRKLQVSEKPVLLWIIE